MKTSYYHFILLHIFSLCEIHCQSLACHSALQCGESHFDLSSKVKQNRRFSKANPPFLELRAAGSRCCTSHRHLMCAGSCLVTDCLENQAWLKCHSLPCWLKLWDPAATQDFAVSSSMIVFSTDKRLLDGSTYWRCVSLHNARFLLGHSTLRCRLKVQWKNERI